MGGTAGEEKQMHQGGMKGAVHHHRFPGRHAEEGEKCRSRKRRIWSLQVQYFVKLDTLELFLLEEDGTQGEAQQPDWIQEH